MATWNECRVLLFVLTNLALRAIRVNPNQIVIDVLTKQTSLTLLKKIGAGLTEAVPTGRESDIDLFLTKWTILIELIYPVATTREHWPCLPFNNSTKKRHYWFN